MKKLLLTLPCLLLLSACTGWEVAGVTTALGIGYTATVLERASDEDGNVTKEAAKEVVDHDVDYVTDHAKKYYAESKVEYPDGYNKAWADENLNQ